MLFSVVVRTFFTACCTAYPPEIPSFFPLIKVLLLYYSHIYLIRPLLFFPITHSSCCCPYCALAQARTNLDDSSLFFNLCFVTSCPTRWMIRTAYGIQGNAYEDCYVPCCCVCCTANQLLQTTEKLGDPFGPAPGQHFLRGNRFIGGSKATYVDCFKAICLPCALASAVQTATGIVFFLVHDSGCEMLLVDDLSTSFFSNTSPFDSISLTPVMIIIQLTHSGMPFLMGCCLSTPCANRNITKVQYRIGENHADFW